MASLASLNCGFGWNDPLKVACKACLKQVHKQVVWLEQEDASNIGQGEEVTLMDWGNAVVEVRDKMCDMPERQSLHNSLCSQPVTHLKEMLQELCRYLY